MTAPLTDAEVIAEEENEITYGVMRPERRDHLSHLLELARDGVKWRERVLEPSAWQPIDSAPKDGRRILVTGLAPLWSYPFVAEWSQQAGREHRRPGGWWKHTDSHLNDLFGVHDSITHWMPMPVIPSEGHSS